MTNDDHRMVAEEYRKTLHAWAAQRVPEGAKVTNVRMNYDDGWDPTFTDRPESLDVVITYEVGTRTSSTSLEMSELTSVGKLLTDLFKIEETS